MTEAPTINLDYELISYSIKSVDNLARIRSMGVTAMDFEGQFRKPWFFVEDYFRQYDGVPTVDSAAAVTGTSFVSGNFDPDFILGEFNKRRVFWKVQKLTETITSRLRSNDPLGALADIEDFASHGNAYQRRSMPTSLMGYSKEVLNLYERVRGGKMGIPYEWETLNRITMGIWPGTVHYFVARPGVGKTFVMMITARKARASGFRVLIISPEMKKVDLAERFLVIDSATSYLSLVRGTLSEFELDKFRVHAENLRSNDDGGIVVADASDDLTESAVEYYIRMVHPDIVLMDSISMMPFKGKDLTERTTNVVMFNRAMVNKYGIALMAAHHMNKNAEKEGGSQGTVALSDHLNRDADSVYNLDQTVEMKMDRIMKIEPIKIRRGLYSGRPIEAHWDFDNMMFGEFVRAPKVPKADNTDAF